MKSLLFFVFTTCIFLSGKVLSQHKDSLEIAPAVFNNTATIRFEIAKTDTVSLQVYNLIGNNVKSFFNDTTFKSGSYSIKYSVNLPGIYIVSLKIGSKTISKKIVNIGAPVPRISLHDNFQTLPLTYLNETSNLLYVAADKPLIPFLQGILKDAKNYKDRI